VSDTYHGTSVIDEYRWLEDEIDPAVMAWSDAQKGYARRVLDNLPNVDSIRSRVVEIMSSEAVSYGSIVFRNGFYFAAKYQPPKEQPFLVAFSSIDQPEDARVLFDPNTFDESGTTSVDWFEPSPDGSLIAICISKGGSEIGDVLVFDTKSGKQVFETVPLVNSGVAGGGLAWDSESRGFYYTRHFCPSEIQEKDPYFYQQLYFHKLGDDVKSDRYELGEDFPKIAEIEVQVHEPTGKVLCTVQNGDGGKFAHYLFRRHESPPHEFTREHVHTLVEEVQLFIEAAHACWERIAQRQIAAASSSGPTAEQSVQ
jgi:prolyl oligopeptidase